MLILELAVDGVDALAFLEGNSHSVNVHCELKNWTLFSFEHNFGKYLSNFNNSSTVANRN